ncbi:MAG: MerR family transcriptional regulator [Lachnospiraceae bacterium]|nr:MerR family transcriptional regulator [Lachnospiraceae bacterium]
MFKIGEFSKLTQVSIRMLRYYDETGLLKPAFIDHFTGYRLYQASQIPDLQKIILLRDLGFSTNEILTALPQIESSDFSALLTQKKEELEEEMQHLSNQILKISAAIKDTTTHSIPVHYNVSIKSIPSYQILSTRHKMKSYYEEGALWQRFYALLSSYQISSSVFPGSLSLFYDDDPEKEIDIEIGFLLPGSIPVKLSRFLSSNALTSDPSFSISIHTLPPVPVMASILVLGSYDHIGNAYHSFAVWLEEHNQYQMCSPIREICHVGAESTDNPDEYITELQTPICRLTLT